MKKFLLLSIMFWGLFFSCDNPTQQEEKKFGNLRGSIINNQTNSPVESAIIKVDNLVTTTNEDGEYYFEKIEVGTRTFIVERMNYLSYADNIEIKEGSNKKDVKITPTFIQRIYGHVYTKFNDPIPDVLIKTEEFETRTDEKGFYEIINIPPGQYTLTVNNEYFYGDTVNVTLPEGEKEQNFYLSTKTITQEVNNISITDKNYSLQLKWNSLELPNLKGYNIYMRVYYPHTMQYNYYSSNPTNFGPWSKINNDLVLKNEFVFNSEEYNCTYEFYILPVNIESIESIKSNNTKIVNIKLPDNYNIINADNYWHKLPNDGELVHRVRWRWHISNYNGNDVYIMITTDGNNWIQIGHMTLDVYGGLVPVGGDMLRSFSINDYAGRTVKFKATGDTQNCILTYGVIQYLY